MKYRDAGVDVTRAEAIRRALSAAVEGTWTDAVRRLPGGFAGVIAVAGAPTLVAATMDGVGTKLHLALAADRVADASADLVFHGANDLLVHGARPLAFLDYVAQARLDPAVVLAVVEGLARACRQVGAALLGGETAEMPDTYVAGVVDVAGCMLGTVAPGELLDGARVRAGDRVLGLASAGLHTNGYSLARRVLETRGVRLEARLPGGAGESVGEALLRPHRWYGPALRPWLDSGAVHALAHVTGGGIAGNLVRVLPEGVRAVLHAAAWPRPPLFRWLIEAGEVPEDDARTAFNLGIGMLAVVPPASVDPMVRGLRAVGETVFEIGSIESGPRVVQWQEGPPPRT